MSTPSRFDLRFNRSPVQFALLSIATIGIYDLVWIARTRYVCQVRFGRSPTAWWHYLAFLVPIANVVLYFRSLSEIEEYVRANGRRPVVRYWVLGLLSAIVDALWRLPDPYWFLSLFSFVLLVPIVNDVRAAQSRGGRFPGRSRLSVGEWAALVLGMLVVTGDLIAVALPDNPDNAGSIATAAANAKFDAALAFALVVAVALVWAFSRPRQDGKPDLFDARAGRLRPDPSEILSWLVAVDGASDAAQVAELRQSVRAQLVAEVARDGLPSGSALPPAAVNLMPAFLSGRAFLASSRSSEGAIDQATRIAALNAFHAAVAGAGVSPTVAELGARACGLEVATEALAANAGDALVLADFGVSSYPRAAAMLHLRGLLKLGGDDAAGALADLENAEHLSPGTDGLAPALVWARERAEGRPQGPTPGPG